MSTFSRLQLINSYTSSSMSSLLSLSGLTSSKKEKHYANRSARRHSGEIVVRKKKKDKDTDTDSVSSSSTDAAMNPEPILRFVLAGLFETGRTGDEKKASGCPLRRVQLWHTIPLCLLAAINLLLVIVALLGLAVYRIVMGIQVSVINLARLDVEFNPYLDSTPDEAESTAGKKVK